MTEVNIVSGRSTYSKIHSDAQLKILDWANGIAGAKIDSTVSLNAAMKKIFKDCKKTFRWVVDEDGSTWELMYGEGGGYKKAWYPWIRIKKSESAQKEGEYLHGVFAARDFNIGDVIGLYMGKFFSLRVKRNSCYLLCYKGKVNIDIEELDEGRLHYGVGSHMMNDLHHFQEDKGGSEDLNNVMIYENLTCGALKDIKCGDELTCTYNLSE